MHESKHLSYVNTRYFFQFILCIALSFNVIGIQAQNFGFSKLNLNGTAVHAPTSLNFGPDGKLYVASEEGHIYVIEIERKTSNDYVANNISVIHLIQTIPNHQEDGSPAPLINKRKVNGLVVSGSISNPVIYVSSFDPRDGVSGNGDMNLDTNSGIVSKLTWTGSKWDMVHLVRGLPRGKEKHGSNGLFHDAEKNILYVAQGGHTNAGAPSTAFALGVEYALSSSILSLDLKVIESLPTKTDIEQQKYKYDLPTVNHPQLISGRDISSKTLPWGGLDGLNQARLVLDGPVQVFAPGFRDPYDVLISESGFMYVTDNGPNAALGGQPHGEGAPEFDGSRYVSRVDNTFDAANSAQSTARVSSNLAIETENGLHLVTAGYYGGHPNPTRANPMGAGIHVDGAFRRMDGANKPRGWPPVDPALANPIEGEFRPLSNAENGVLVTLPNQVKGITEYTASNFRSSLKGDILMTTFASTGKIVKITPSPETGTGYAPTTLASGIGDGAIDLDALGDKEIFPGTIWIAVNKENKITILEPIDYGQTSVPGCNRVNDPNLDDDGDGYSNADELDPRNATDPCSVDSYPKDTDQSTINGWKLSDWNDPDDDDDGIPDLIDPFALDPSNGANLDLAALPKHFSFKPVSDSKGPLSRGFTGLMVNGKVDYQTASESSPNLLKENNKDLYTLTKTDGNAPFHALNTDKSSHQIGLKLCDANEPVWIRTQINGPFFSGGSSQEYLQGMYIGSGDQDNFVLLALNGDGKGGAGFKIVEEIEGLASERFYSIPTVLSETSLNLFWELNPNQHTAQAYYTRGNSDEYHSIGPTILLTGKTLAAMDCSYRLNNRPSYLAVGLLAKSGSAKPFSATYDYLEIYTDRQSCPLETDKREINFQAISENSNKTLALKLENPMMSKLDISHIEITGRDADMFSINQESFVDLDAHKSAELSVKFNPLTSGTKEANLKIYTSCSSKAIEIPLSGVGATFSEVLYRVNAGGEKILATDGGLDWMSDEASKPISYVSKGGGEIASGTSSEELFYHSSVPSSTPTALFKKGRQTSATETNMQWTFPLPGKEGSLYQVCLYMVNSCACSSEDGQRVFDLEIEGKKVAEHMDLAGQFGHQTAVTLCYPIKLGKDGKLDINFLRDIKSPIVNAIEIRAVDNRQGNTRSKVELMDFHAQVRNKSIIMDWSTSSENNNQGFIIQMLQERDGSAALFQDIGFVEGRGNSSKHTGYTYEINDLVPDTYVFRLKQLDNSGNYTYSNKIRASILSDEIGIYTYPNPTKGILNVTLTTQKEQSVSLNLLDANGKKVDLLYNETTSAGSHKLGFNIGGFPDGIYLLEANNGQVRKVSKVILSK